MQDEHPDENLQGRIDHKTAYITPQTLISSVDDWTRECSLRPLPANTPSTNDPEPILFVALHACGSLTPAVIKAVSSTRFMSPNGLWKAAGCVVVGCCYNLMDVSANQDFPLSSQLQQILSGPDATRYSMSLAPSHLQLAAQAPLQWLRDNRSRDAQALALRKVAWRALLGGKLHPSSEPPSKLIDAKTGKTSLNLRLGRLPDRVYRSWTAFAGEAQTRIRVETQSLPVELGVLTDADETSVRRIEIVQTLRYLLGPVVESLIVLDRLKWVEENLDSDASGAVGEVRLVRLFDQAVGSARNLAITIT